MPCCNTPYTSVYSSFCAVNAVIPHTTQNGVQGFTGSFPAIDPFNRQQYQTGTGGYNTAIATPERIAAPGHPPAHTRYKRHTGRCTGQRSRPIIIRYIMAQQCACYRPMPNSAADRRPCQPGGVSSHRLRVRWQVLRPAHLLRGQRLHLYEVSPAAVSLLPTPGGLQSGTGSAVRAGILAPCTRRGSPATGARRAARNHWRLAPQLFSGFRPIANKGEK